MKGLGWPTFAAVAALVALELHLGSPGEAWWWPMAALFTCWTAAPLVVPWLVARRWPRLIRPAGVALLASSLVAAIGYRLAFYGNPSSTAALALIFVPLWQWAALLVAGGAAMLAGKFRRD